MVALADEFTQKNTDTRSNTIGLENVQFPGRRNAISGQRYYNPSTGRWLSRDPIGEQSGANLYVMVQNNAVGQIDAYGLEAGYTYGSDGRMSFDAPPYVPYPQWVNSTINVLLNGPDDYDQGNMRLARRLLAHYLNGDTSEMRLSSDELGDAIGIIDLRGKPEFLQRVRSASEGCSMVSRLKAAHYARTSHTLGQVDLVLDGELCKCKDTWRFAGTVSIRDQYDFDTHWIAALKTEFLKKPGGRRLFAEMATEGGTWLPGNAIGFPVVGGPEPLSQKNTDTEAQWVGAGRWSGSILAF